MRKKKDNLGWIVGSTIVVSFLIAGWILNDIYYAFKPYTIDTIKEKYIRAQQKCGVRNVLTKVDDNKDFKYFTCQDWEEATKSGIQK